MRIANRLAARWIAIFVFFAAVLAPARVFADDTDTGIQSGVSLGGRAEYFKPKDASTGDLSGGVQLRLHFLPMLAVEGSVDLRQETLGLATVDVVPVQASLLVYLLPSLPISPYVLGGVGLYYTHVQSPGDSTVYRFGPHAGFGLEWTLNHSWSIDADYRYLWNSAVNSPTVAHPGGQNFSDNGSMITAGLNYHF